MRLLIRTATAVSRRALRAPPRLARLLSSFAVEYQTRAALNTLVAEYALHPLRKPSLNELLEDSLAMLPLPAREAERHYWLMEHARQTLEVLLAYHGRRIAAFRQLPYIVTLNPHIAGNYTQYLTTMQQLLEVQATADADWLKSGCMQVLEQFIATHADTISQLLQGFQEVLGTLVDEETVRAFLVQHLEERIYMRLIARQHMALFNPPTPNHMGAIDLGMRPAHIVRQCSQFVNDMCAIKYDAQCELEIDAGEELVFPYIPPHVEYVVTEVLKNSSRALIEQGLATPIVVTIAQHGDHLEIRVRDRAGGIPQAVVDRVFEFSFTTYSSGYDDEVGDAYKALNTAPGTENTVAGMGYGLPMSRVYCEMFGGRLEVQSYAELGTDVYLRFRGVDKPLLEQARVKRDRVA